MSKLYEYAPYRFYERFRKYDIAILSAQRRELTDVTNYYIVYNHDASDTIANTKVIPRDKSGKPRKSADGSFKTRPLDKLIPFQLTRDDNKRRHKQLLDELRTSEFSNSFQVVKGAYAENGVRKEEVSVVVFNSDGTTGKPVMSAKEFFNHMRYISEQFNQDSILFKPRGTDEAFLIGTNKSEWLGYGKSVTVGSQNSQVVALYQTQLKSISFAFLTDDDHKNQYNVDHYGNRRVDNLNKKDPRYTPDLEVPRSNKAQRKNMPRKNINRTFMDIPKEKNAKTESLMYIYNKYIKCLL